MRGESASTESIDERIDDSSYARRKEREEKGERERRGICEERRQYGKRERKWKRERRGAL